MLKLYVGSAPSASYQLSKVDLINIGKVVLWSCISTLVACVIALLPNVVLPLQWAWLIPLVNTVLVALYKFVSNKSAENPVPSVQ